MGRERSGTNADARAAARLASIDRWLVLAVLLLALILRAWRLDGQSLWYDEAVTAQVATQGIAELTRWTADDIQPPLYYYLVSIWVKLAGRSEWMLRFPSALFGTLIVALLWAVARRVFGRGSVGRAASLVAALLAAVSPLYVYYSQEARMYTMLTFLGTLAGYALLRAVMGERARPRAGNGADQQARGSPNGKSQRASASTLWWLGFVFASSAMLYTHYFGWFSLLAYGMCFLAASVSRAWRPAARVHVLRQLSWSVLAAAAIAGLYAPWLPAMLNRYRADRSYWQGSLKLGEALRHVAISFTSGAPEMMLESQAVRLLPWFGAALAITGGALVWRMAEDGRGAVLGGDRCRYAPVYLAACLLIPLFSVLALASRTPKFNARYLMMVSPAYLLILAGGVGVLLERARMRMATGGSRVANDALSVVGGVVVIVFLVVSSLSSVRNWFVDPAFTKAQWRELAATVRARIGVGETVLLVSGHASPAWDYYAPDVPRTRLPDIDVLDVETVLGFDVAPVLADALRNKNGVWVVLWQEEAVDPVGFVLYFLDRAGEEVPVDAAFWHVGLRHWRLLPNAAYPAEPRPDHMDGANFGHRIALLGWDDPEDGQLMVYWRALNPIHRDYRVSLILEDNRGGEIGRWDGRPAGYDRMAGYTYPTFRWRPGAALLGRYPLPLSEDASEGPYYVTLALYDDIDPAGLDIMDVADNPAGKRVRLGPMSIVE